MLWIVYKTTAFVWFDTFFSYYSCFHRESSSSSNRERSHLYCLRYNFNIWLSFRTRNRTCFVKWRPWQKRVHLNVALVVYFTDGAWLSHLTWERRRQTFNSADLRMILRWAFPSQPAAGWSDEWTWLTRLEINMFTTQRTESRESPFSQDEAQLYYHMMKVEHVMITICYHEQSARFRLRSLIRLWTDDPVARRQQGTVRQNMKTASSSNTIPIECGRIHFYDDSFLCVYITIERQFTWRGRVSTINRIGDGFWFAEWKKTNVTK